jgi:hypothetical protein
MLYQKKLFANKKKRNHNMAGGFDGIAVTNTTSTRGEHYKAQASVIAVR